MGYDEHQHSNSSAAATAVLVAAMIVAVLGILAIAGVALFWVQAVRSDEQQAIATETRAVVEERTVELRSALEEARAEATVDPRLNLEVKLDREGLTSNDGERISLDELRAKLVKLKTETSNAFSVQISTHSECPARHLIAVAAVCDEVGDIDYRITSLDDSPVRMTATVASYKPAAEWDHYDDGTFSVYDTLTLTIVAPERHAGIAISITVPPTELPQDSALRTAGTHLTFTMQESRVRATGLAWGALDDPTIQR